MKIYRPHTTIFIFLKKVFQIKFVMYFMEYWGFKANKGANPNKITFLFSKIF